MKCYPLIIWFRSYRDYQYGNTVPDKHGTMLTPTM